MMDLKAATRRKHHGDPAVVADVAGLLAFGWRQPGVVLAGGFADGSWVSELADALGDGLVAGKKSTAGSKAGNKPGNNLDRGEFRAAAQVLGTWASGKEAGLIEEELGAEYAALFQGPDSPLVGFYECQWLDDKNAMLFSAPATQMVEQAYRTAGLELATREPGDSFPAELEFVRHLAAEEAAQSGAGSRALADRSRSLRRAFVRDHLDRWLADFCGAVQAGTECAAYAALARITTAIGQSGVLGR